MGTAGGRRAQEEVKMRPYRKAQTDLEEALRQYGARCRQDGALDRLRDLIRGPSHRAHEALEVLDIEAAQAKATWRWRLWPTESQVLAVATHEHALGQVEVIDQRGRDLQARLTAIATGEGSDEALGLLFSNQADLRNTCGCELPELDAVRLTYIRARRRRASLSHPLTKSEQAQALKTMVRRRVSAREDS